MLAAALMCAATIPASGQTAVKFSLDWRLEGPVAPFFHALDKGYFRSRGLDVTIDEAASALEPITRVAAGTHNMAFADVNTLIRHRDQNPSAAINAVFMVYNRPPYAIISRKSRGVTVPKNLEGKKLGAPSIGATFGQWPLFAKLNDIDTSKVTIETIAVPVRAPMLAAGQLDAAVGYSFRVFVDLKDRGVPVDDIVLLPMASFGVKLYGSAIIVNPKFATEHPDAVKAFLQAYLRALKDAIHNPQSAIDAVLKREDSLKKDVELERLRMAIRDNIVTPETRAQGLGAIDEARFEEALSQIALTHTFKAKPRAADLFDPTFLPPAADRKIN